MKPMEAVPGRNDAEMVEALKYGPVRRFFTEINAPVWPERFRRVGYCYEMEKELFKLKTQGKPLTSYLEQTFREEGVPQSGDKKEWKDVNSIPGYVSDYEGAFEVECYITMFLTLRNHLGELERRWELRGCDIWMSVTELNKFCL